MSIEETTFKTCKRCQEKKLLIDFDNKRTKKYPEQLRAECKECRKAYNKRKYAERKEKGYYKKLDKE
jgi:hypothetical protein